MRRPTGDQEAVKPQNKQTYCIWSCACSYGILQYLRFLKEEADFPGIYNLCQKL